MSKLSQRNARVLMWRNFRQKYQNNGGHKNRTEINMLTMIALKTTMGVDKSWKYYLPGVKEMEGATLGTDEPAGATTQNPSKQKQVNKNNSN